MSDLTNALRESGLFRGLEERRLAAVAQAAVETVAPPGQLIIVEGDPGDRMFLVLDGAVQALVHDREGREVVLARIEAGGHFGEQALLPGSSGRRNATVRTVTRTRLAEVPKAAFEAVLSVDDALRERVLDLSVERMARHLEALSPLARALEVASLAPAPRQLRDGEVLFRQGDEADALYLVRSGTLVVSREEAGETRMLGQVGRGACVGELGLLERSARSATAVALGPVELLAIDAAQFRSVYERSDQLRDTLATLRRAYELPARGVATQHSGTFDVKDWITTLYHLTDGRRFAAYRPVGNDVYALERLDVQPPAERLRFALPGSASRELRLAPDGTVLGLTARGEWPDASAVHLFVLDGGRVGAAERERFGQNGSPLAAGPIEATTTEAAVLCRCVGVGRDRLRAAIDAGATTFDRLQAETGCGTVCGGCVPQVLELLGGQSWLLADVVEERDEAPGIRSFVLAPRTSPSTTTCCPTCAAG
jgi:CRP-like cAMP-binding protein/bacterioferritin-associated ferredoxin